MARNGTGTYVLPAGQPVVTATTISSTTFNTLTADLATALTTSICTDGQTPMAATLSMGSHKISNLTDGTLATDAASKGQVDAAAATASAATSAASATAAAATVTAQAAIPARNVLVNGDFSIVQRGTTYALTTTPAYGSIDGWAAYQATAANGIFNRVSVTGGTRLYNAKLGRTAASVSTNAISMAQVLESANSIPLAGQTVILSLYLQAGANFSGASSQVTVTLHTGKGVDQSMANMVGLAWTTAARPINTLQTITTTLTRYTFTVAIPSDVTQIGVQISYTPSGTAGADDNLYVADAQLEPALNGATTASTFERLSRAQNLAICKRYYEQSYGVGSGPASVTTSGVEQSIISTATLLASGRIRYSVEKRAAPTVTLYSPNSGSTGVVGEYNTSSVFVADRASTVVNGASTGATVQINAVGTIANNAFWHWAATAEL